jgi:hypothetical protein
MTRIYFVYAKNIFMEYPDYFMATLFGASFFICVSIHDVMFNVPKDNFPNFFHFMMVAMRDTHWFIQLLAIGGITRVIFVSFKFIQKNIHFINWLPVKLKY